MIYDANPPYDFWVSLHRAARGGIGQSTPRLHRPPPVEGVTKTTPFLEGVTSTPPSSEGELKGVVFGTGIAQRGGGILSAYPRLHRPPPVEGVTKTTPFLEGVTSTPPSSEGELKGVVLGTGIAQRGGGILSAYPRLHRPPPVEGVTSTTPFLEGVTSTPPSSEGELKGVVLMP